MPVSIQFNQLFLLFLESSAHDSSVLALRRFIRLLANLILTVWYLDPKLFIAYDSPTVDLGLWICILPIQHSGISHLVIGFSCVYGNLLLLLLRLAPLILQFHIVILVLHLDLIKSFHFHYSVILASKFINMLIWILFTYAYCYLTALLLKLFEFWIWWFWLLLAPMKALLFSTLEVRVPAPLFYEFYITFGDIGILSTIPTADYYFFSNGLWKSCCEFKGLLILRDYATNWFLLF